MKRRAPALPDSATFQQLWDALGSKLEEIARGNLLYTQGVRGSSPLPPTIVNNRENYKSLLGWLFGWHGDSVSHQCFSTSNSYLFDKAS